MNSTEAGPPHRLGSKVFWLRAAFCVLFMPILARAESSALILTGVAGDDQHAQKFLKWTEGTRKALADQFGFAANRIVVLSDRKTTKSDVEGAFAQLKLQLKPADSFFFFLIGHGSNAEGEYKLNISGPDLTGTEYAALLSTLPAGRIVIVNSTSASGASIEAFSGKNRTVITATRSGQEGNDTVFYDYFLKALQDTASDTDKDRKLSVWEAFKFASDAVDRFYKDEGRLATEHAVVSDNGPSKTPATATELPVIARMTVFQVDRPSAVGDPKLQALLVHQKEIQQQQDALLINKAALPEAEYQKQLESLLIERATVDQQIRELQKK